MLIWLMKFYREAADGAELLQYPLDGESPPMLTKIQYSALFFDESDEEEKEETKEETKEENKEENKEEAQQEN